MKTTNIKSFFLNKEVWLQIIIWTLYFASINVNWTKSWISESFLPESVAPHIALIAPTIFLLNVYWFIPKYLNKKQWFTYVWLSLSLLAAFVIVRASIFAIALQNEMGFIEMFKKELFGENSIVFGILNVLVFNITFFSFVYKFTRDWLINQTVIESLKFEKEQLLRNSLQVAGFPDANSVNLATNAFNKTKAKTVKRTLTAKKRDGTYLLRVEDVLYFQAQGDFVFAYAINNSKHIINDSLKTIREQICKSDFFQVNRSELVNFNYINKFKSHTKNRLEISLHHTSSCIYTSNSRTPEFRLWIEQH
nr:LytTR family DNA-binding domain-containing protein [uncultured Psychroserpens sp.]